MHSAVEEKYNYKQQREKTALQFEDKNLPKVARSS